MRRPQPILRIVAERKRGREAVAEAILGRISEMSVEAVSWKSDCIKFQDELGNYYDLSLAQGSAGGAFLGAGNMLRAGVPKLVSMGHDVEVVVPITSVLRQLGLELDQIVPKVEHQLGRGVMLTIEQAGTAVIAFDSGSDCLVTVADHATLYIPAVMTVGDHATHFNLNVSFAIRTLDPFHRQFQVILTRRAHICPPVDIEQALLDPLLSGVDEELARFDGQIIEIGALPDLGSQMPDPYAARLGNNVRLHFALARRSRREVAPLPGLPDWADTGIKVVPETLHSILRKQVSQSGFAITGISYPARNVVDVSTHKEHRYTKRVFKIDFGVRIRINAVVRCIISVTPNRNLAINYRSTSIDIDIDIVPRVIGWLLAGAEAIAEEIVEGFARDVSGEAIFQLPSSRRTEVAVTAENLAIYLKTSYGQGS